MRRTTETLFPPWYQLYTQEPQWLYLQLPIPYPEIENPQLKPPAEDPHGFQVIDEEEYSRRVIVIDM